MRQIIKSFFIGLAALAIVLVGANFAMATGGGGDHKITICHVEPKKNPHTITIDESAWPAHKAHGDYKGSCSPQCTPGPTVTVPGPTVTATVKVTKRPTATATVTVPGPTVSVPGPETTETVTATATATETKIVETPGPTTTVTETAPGSTVTETVTAPAQTVTATSFVTETATSTVTATATETATSFVTETATLPAQTVTATMTETLPAKTATVETTKIKTIVSEGSNLAKTGIELSSGWPYAIALLLLGGTALVMWSRRYKHKH